MKKDMKNFILKELVKLCRRKLQIIDLERKGKSGNRPCQRP